MEKCKLKQIIKFSCFLLFASVVVFAMFLVNHLGMLPAVPDVLRTFPIVSRVLPMADRVSQHFPQDVVYEQLHDFVLDGDTIHSVSYDPQIQLNVVPEQTGRLLKIDISELCVERTSAQIFFAFEGEHFSEANSVRFVIENGANIVILPYSGYDRLRLDLAEIPDVSMVVNDVTSANYVSLPASLLVSFISVVLVYGIVLYFWFFRKSLISLVCNKLKEPVLSRIDCRSEKVRYIVAVLVIGLLMAVTYWFTPLHFGNNDEHRNMYTVAGYLTGTPSPLLLYSNVVFGYFLSGLYTLIPMIAWYSVMHVVFIFVSHVMILKSFMKIAARMNVAQIVPVSLFVILFAFFLFYNTAALFFTTTPAMIGAAACVLVASLYQGESKRARIVDIVTIVTLLFFAYTIRSRSGMGVIPFFSVVVAFKVIMSLIGKEALKHKVRQICSYAIIGICLVTTFALARGIDSHLSNYNGMRDFREFNAPFARYFNFPSVSYDDAPELYASIGWDRELPILVNRSFILDERITAENIRLLNEYQRANQMELPFLYRLENAIELAGTFITNNVFPRSAVTVFILAVLVHLAVLIKRVITDKLDRWEFVLHILFSLAISGGFFVSLLWLGLGGLSADAIGGRINVWAFVVPLMPAAGLLFWHIMYTWAPILQGGVKKYFPVALLVCFVIGFYFVSVPFRVIYDDANSPIRISRGEQRLAAERYAIDNPENIYIFDAYLQVFGEGVPVFTTYGEERPINLIKWGVDSFPSANNSVFRANNLDGLSAGDLLQPNFYFLSHDISHMITNIFFRYMENRYNATPVVIDVFGGIYVVDFIR